MKRIVIILVSIISCVAYSQKIPEQDKKIPSGYALIDENKDRSIYLLENSIIRKDPNYEYLLLINFNMFRKVMVQNSKHPIEVSSSVTRSTLNCESNYNKNLWITFYPEIFGGGSSASKFESNIVEYTKDKPIYKKIYELVCPDYVNNQKSTIKIKSEEIIDLTKFYLNISKNSRILYEPNPFEFFPKISKRLLEEGSVKIEFYVNTDGDVYESKITKSSNFDRLDNAALKIISLTKFIPYVEGETVYPFKSTKTYVFRLD